MPSTYAITLYSGLATMVSAAAVTHSVPNLVPTDAAVLDSAPVGASFEFFAWPTWMKKVTPTLQCIDHLTQLYGKPMPVRIGGTTQDRATYDPNLDSYVNYSVSSPMNAPSKLTYGPSFFDLIVEYGGETMLGLNRGNNDKANSFAAAIKAKSIAGKYLWAVEMGNEPDRKWIHPPEYRFLLLAPLPIVAAGSYATSRWNMGYLINEAFNNSVKSAVKVYSGHLYAGGNQLSEGMNHAQTSQELSWFADDTADAKQAGRNFILGENNFQDPSGNTPHVNSFGGALFVLDRSLRAASIGRQRLFYHQGTVTQANYNWWGPGQVGTPFYGAYMAVKAVAGGDHIYASDAGNTRYAQYVIYKDDAPSKVILINTDYYSGSGTRSTSTFTLTGLKVSSVKTTLMKAESSELRSYQVRNQPSRQPTIGGQYFANSNCALTGTFKTETKTVSGGKATFTLQASEALLIEL
ncbi:Glyco-hydro-79C domain-containing protein [Fusarium sp. LHS14.1]|nr:Glyco-hydro-79C domain-containing protein [Fusarium sp. LHS14.1]